MKNTYTKKVVWPLSAITTLFLMFMIQGLSAQTLSGPTSVNQGSTYNYYIYATGVQWSTWSSNGGTIMGSSTTSASVRWDSSGSRSVSASFQDAYNYYYKTLNVTVSSSTPSTPPTPTVAKYCGYTRLTRATPPSGVTYYWQSSSSGTSTANSASYVDLTSGTTYYLKARNISSGIWSSASSVSYTIDSSPLAPSSVGTTNNCGNTILTRSNPPSGTTWYWQSTPTGTSTSNSATTMTFTSGTVYYLRARNNTTGCWGPETTANYTVYQVPSTPTAPTVTIDCGSTVLTRSSPPSGTTWYWQSSASGTSTTDSNSTKIMTSGTTYYLRARNNVGQCWSASSSSVAYTIKNIPLEPTAPSVTNNCGNTVLTRTSPPSGTTWYWQSSSTGTSTSNSATSVTQTSGTTYYLRARDNNSLCWSTSETINYTIKNVPSEPTAPSVTSNCGNTVLTRTSPPSGTTWYWQSSSSGTSTSNTATSVTQTSGTTYYLRARDNNSLCWSTSETINYTIKNVPSEPTAPSVTNNCGNTVLTRTSPPNGTTWYWQSSSSGTSISNTATSITQTSGTTYYLRARDNSSLCWSTSETINYTIKNVPSEPTVPIVTENCGNTILTRGTPPSGTTWYWQSSSSGTDISDFNNTKTLTGGTVYYLRARDDSSFCWSTAAMVNYVINPGPIWYADSDGDGFGDPSSSLRACVRPAGYVENGQDLCISSAGKNFGCINGSSSLGAYAGVTKSDENYIYTRNYQSAMTSENEIWINADIIEEIAYFDGLGRPIQNIAIKASGEGMTPCNSESNIGEWSMDWTPGSGSTNFFNMNGDTVENLRENGSDPHGRISLLWECGNGADSGPDGGWNTDYFNVDKNSTYRYTVWVKRTHSQNGTTYHGTQNVDNLNGGANTNPYFWYGDLPQLDTWYLLVGVVHPMDYSGGDTGVSGVYDLQGSKVLDGTEFKWSVSTTTSRFRSYLYYSTDVSVRQYFHEPVLQKMDNSADALTDIINGTKGTDDLKDIVSHVGYDDYGRQDKDWLPYRELIGNLGSYRGDVANETQQFYLSNYASDYTGMVQTEVNAYSEKDFDSSPLNRILLQGAPGKDWKLGNNNEIRFEYSANGTDEVRRYDVTTNLSNNTYIPTLVENGNYAPDELQKSITYDENYSIGTDHSTEEFLDKTGRVVLIRTYESSVAHDTYYVYDNFGNLTFVIPPKVDASDGVSTAEFDEICYQYVYDNKNRLVEKKIPGKGWEYIVYNKMDQPIMIQDANMSINDQWSFTLYDAFGRIAYTGQDNGNISSRGTVQTAANAVINQYVTKQSSPTTYAGTPVYYSKNAYPDSFDEVYMINYYDNYTFDLDGLSVPSTVLGQPKAANTQGLPTGSKVRVLGTNAWITTVMGYDQKGRSIYTASKNNYLGTLDILETELDFAGKVIQKKATHTKDSNVAIVTVDIFTYDHTGRLLTQKQSINNAPKETIVDNSYDNLGQLVSKKVGGGLQTVDYTYNVRGWLKSINNGTTSGTDLFGFKINYNTTTENTGASALFNGNISETIWETANDNIKRAYGYYYDPLNRITAATGTTSNYNVSNIIYDKNGNITSLQRQGHTNLAATTFGVMDNLAYTYDSGNKLTKVTDTGNQTYGFKDGVNQTIEFVYDLNGNMISDANKGITSISYNQINLPTEVKFDDNNLKKITYIYDAMGSKLQKIVTDGSPVTTDYAGNYIYENGNLRQFSHSEGYVEPDGNGGYDYVYSYLDHLGNVRLNYSDLNGNGTIEATSEILAERNYYPFGLEHKGYNNVVNGAENPYKYQGKEHEEELGYNMYDFDMRHYDPAIGRWVVVDPLAEQMRRYSPYNFAFDNPIRFIDPDGMAPEDVIIKGSEKQAAFNELQTSVSSELTLAMDKNGKVTYTQNNGTGKLSKDAQQLTSAIDDSSIVVNVNAENTTTTAAGDLYIGGAFSGNTVTKGANGNTVAAEQEVNPGVLNKASTGNGNPGADILHEVTEAYQGGLISQKSGVSSPAANKAGTVYNKAHRKATSQSGAIYETLYDGAGNVLQMTPSGNYPTGVKSVEWSVKNKGKTTIIQTLK